MLQNQRNEWQGNSGFSWKNTHKEVCKFVTRKSVSSFKVSLLAGEINWAPQQKTRARAEGQVLCFGCYRKCKKRDGSCRWTRKGFLVFRRKKQKTKHWRVHNSLGWLHLLSRWPCWSVLEPYISVELLFLLMQWQWKQKKQQKKALKAWFQIFSGL